MSEEIYSILSDFTRRKPPINVEGLARTLGLEVNKDADLPWGVSGHLRRVNDDNYEISANRREHYFRQRFTLAHEIGHYVLHKSLVDRRGGVDDDTQYRSTEIGDIYNSYIELIHEKQANSFAANLLMPERHVRDAVDLADGPISLEDLYKKFQVSASAMRWRLRNLNLWDQTDQRPKRSEF